MLRKCTVVATFGTRYCFSPSEKGRHGEDETTLAYVSGIRKSKILVPRHRCQLQRLTMKFRSRWVAKLLCRDRISPTSTRLGRIPSISRRELNFSGSRRFSFPGFLFSSCRSPHSPFTLLHLAQTNGLSVFFCSFMSK